MRKKGLDSVWYVFEVYEKELIPYYKRLKSTYPDKIVYILEDNAPAHLKARRVMLGELAECGMLDAFIQWPKRSPNLHQGMKRAKQYC